MSPNEKGVFPSWIDEDDIISQLLNKMLSEDGKVPLSYVINPEHLPATQDRMRKIIAFMEQEKLINPLSNESANIEIGLNGRKAAIIGYRKFQRMNRRGLFSTKLSVIFFRLILVGGSVGLLYLLLHYFKLM